MIPAFHLDLLYQGVVAANLFSCPFVLIQKDDPEASGQGGEFPKQFAAAAQYESKATP